MKSPGLRLLTLPLQSLLPLLSLLSLLSGPVAAQPAAAASAAAVATPASAPREAIDTSKLPQRRLPAAQAHERSTMPGDLRPSHPVVPLFSIPLGRTEPPAPKPPSRAPRPSLSASSPGADSTAPRPGG